MVHTTNPRKHVALSTRGQYGQSQGSQSPYQQGPYGQQGTTGYQQQQYQYQQPRSPYGRSQL